VPRSSRAMWTRMAPTPAPIAEVGVAALDATVHVVGGSDERGVTLAAHWAYDTAADAWQERRPLPAPMHHVGVTTIDGLLYAIGGLRANVHMEPQPLALAYDPAADRWDELTPLPSPRGSAAVVPLDRCVHVIGGRDAAIVDHVTVPDGRVLTLGIGTLTAHEVYNVATGEWAQRAPLPGPSRDHMGVAVLDERIHVFGGRVNDYTDMLERHDVYDPHTDTWSSAAPLPQPRSAGAFTVLDGHIIYAGGECKPGGAPFTANAFDDVDAYDPENDRWVTWPSLPEGRHAFGAATVDAVAYFVGGALLCGGGATTDVLALELV